MDFLCREHSSVGLERLLDKQEVCGSNPHVPTSFEAFVRRFGQRLFFVARLGKRAACRNGPQQTPPPKIPLGPLPPAVPKIRLEPLPPAVPQPCPRAALRHAPHPKTPSRLHGKNVRFVGRSGSLPREPQPVPDAPFAGAPPIPSPNTLALRHAVRLRIDGFPQKRKPLLFSRGFRGKLGRDDWIRTSDHTPPRRVL